MAVGEDVVQASLDGQTDFDVPAEQTLEVADAAGLGGPGRRDRPASGG